MRTKQSRLRLGVIFGGVSTEHEISIMTGLQLIDTIDTQRFEVVPIYISMSGAWYTGAELFQLSYFKGLPGVLSRAREIALLPNPQGPKLVFVDRSRADKGMYRLEESESLNVDIVFLALHGTHGEDGAIQGLLKMAKIPFVGSGIRSSAITMNKYVSKVVAAANGIPTLPSVIAKKADFIKNFKEAYQDILSQDLTFPVIVKPCNLGSSVGLNFADTEAQLKQALVAVFKVDEQAIIEPRVVDLTEINVSVIGRTNPRASVIEVPLSGKELLTYEKKYMAGSGSKKGSKTRAGGMANLQREVNSTRIPETLKEEARDLAVRLFTCLDCAGLVRIDFIYDNQKEALYFNELNSIPGSFAYYLWVQSSPRYLLTELVNLLVDEALEEFGMQETLAQTQPFRALR
ncbi:MAG: hypothetical protein H6563_01480 [Lewinellaceae bacterium]|nr:hypothetical protein [Lewinellaceae bacterium]